MNLYFALTIGPIYRTMGMARSTREIWLSSYIFSYLMATICESLKKYGEILIPNVPEDTELANKYKNSQAGLFPDRLIMLCNKSDTSSKDLILEIVQDKSISILDDSLKEDRGFLKQYKEYIQVYSVFIEIKEKENPIDILFPILESLEQRPSYIEKYNGTHPILEKILLRESKKKGIMGTDTPVAAYDDRIPSLIYKKEGIKFPSLQKISRAETAEKEQPEMRYWNYPAYVQADGDGMGYFLHALFEVGGMKAVQKFSNFMFEYGYEATEQIVNYKGKPIYMGGDDMLFIAPVKNGDTTIFCLIKNLNELFNRMIQENEDLLDSITEWNSSITKENKRKPIHPSISYSVFVAYYKYPMKESLLSVRDLLFTTAKSMPGKNAVAFSLLKHSGHCVETCWSKNKKDKSSFYFFLEMIKEHILVTDSFLNSLQYKLKVLEPLLTRILVGRDNPFETGTPYSIISGCLPDESFREYAFKNLTYNFFNEVVHDIKYRGFIDKMFYYLLFTYRELEDIYGNNGKTAKEAVNNLYTVLRFLHFLNKDNT
ncbi:MAG: type III-B CRISPR-associated protein Cas10/Cmr2 [Bacteroidales bacterium]|jgi:CRISPR-associated protein Cmr2